MLSEEEAGAGSVGGVAVGGGVVRFFGQGGGKRAKTTGSKEEMREKRVLS